MVRLWVHLSELSRKSLGAADAQTAIAQHSSIDRAMRDAFRKLRRFLMTAHKLSEDEDDRASCRSPPISA